MSSPKGTLLVHPCFSINVNSMKDHTSCNACSSPLFLNLRVLKLPDLIKLLNICLIYSILNKTAPPALIDIYNLTMCPDSHGTRGNSLGLITTPICRTFQYGINSIAYQSIGQWNQLWLLHPGLDLSNISIN